MGAPRTGREAWRTSLPLICALVVVSLPGIGAAQEAPPPPPQAQAETQTLASAVAPVWQYGGFADLGYLLDFNYPSNHLFRFRSTTFKVNELDLNMAAVYVKKAASEHSRWGTEFALQAGKDSEGFGYSNTAPNVGGAKWLRHIGLADVSYLAPVGSGLTIQAGIWSSLLGYDGLYAKDNFTYTRPWAGDYTPYLMMGVNVSYPFSKKITGTFFAVNGFSHLAHANDVPSLGGQIAYQATSHLTLKETLFYGPQQSDTSLEYWRFFTDSIVEWKTDRHVIAFEYQAGTEDLATAGNPRIFWTIAQLPLHWILSPHWSVTLRPEVFWDPQGRQTGADQFIKANTETLEYRWPFRRFNTLVRLEHRFDNSTGKGGGFFNNELTPFGTVGLTPTQNLLILAVMTSFDSPPHQ
jgi:putative OmpL-like beta-barrel porin-2